MTMSDEDGGGDRGRRHEASVQALLAEFETNWSELFSRWETQRNTFAQVISIVAVVVGLAFSTNVDLAPEVFYALPAIVAAFAFTFFDNELMIWSLVGHTCNRIGPAVQKLVRSDVEVFTLERNRFEDLGERIARVHVTLSIGRWLVFLLPMVFSLLYACIASKRRTEWPFLAATVIDVCLIGYFLGVMTEAVRARKNLWGKKPSVVRDDKVG